MRFLFAASMMSLLLTTATNVAAQEPRRVAAGFLFEGPLLDIRAPRDKGWSVVDQDKDGLIFMRKGRKRDASFIASVTPFEIAVAADAAGFEAQMRDRLRKDFDENRFERLEESIVANDLASVKCFRYTTAAIDRAAQIDRGKTRRLALDLHALYCRHPADAALGIAITYSYRSPERDVEKTARDAQAFFDDVVFKWPATPLDDDDQ
jgi:hypothetical protein